MNVFKLIEDNGLTLYGDIEHFAELIRQEEREACAKLCEEEIKRVKPVYSVTAENCVKAIRARGEQ